jgi:hypothetical protein
MKLLRRALWPITVLILVWSFYAPLKASLEGLSEINAGPFQAKLERAARNQGLHFQTSELATLTMDQLQTFLIAGGEKGQELTVEFRHGSTDKLKRDFDRLHQLGLVRVTDTKERTGKPPNVFYDTTEKGRKIHKLIMDQLYEELVLLPNRRP